MMPAEVMEIIRKDRKSRKEQQRIKFESLASTRSEDIMKWVRWGGMTNISTLCQPNINGW